jgi:hypothetical protein
MDCTAALSPRDELAHTTTPEWLERCKEPHRLERVRLTLGVSAREDDKARIGIELERRKIAKILAG